MTRKKLIQKFLKDKRYNGQSTVRQDNRWNTYWNDIALTKVLEDFHKYSKQIEKDTL